MKKILLISGHGAGDPGATAKHGGVLYQEAVEAEALVKKIALTLDGYDVEKIVYPYERDAYQDWKAGKLALTKADLLVEIHFNAFQKDSGDGRKKGVEVYYRPNAVAGAMQAATQLSAAIAQVLGAPNRGAKTGVYAVIGYANALGTPAVLVEVCFIDDADDWAAYMTHRDAVAETIAQVACAHVGAEKKKADVTAGCSTWAKDDCEWAAAMGLFRGDENGDFRWPQPVTREELAAVLRRMAG